MYKKLFITSLAVNVILGIVVAIFIPRSKGEWAVVKDFRHLSSKENQQQVATENMVVYEYCDHMLNDISKDWEPTSLLRQFDSDIAAQIENEKLEQTTQTYSALGSFKESRAPKGILDIAPNQKRVMLNSIFENGSAKVSIDVIKRNEEWFIRNININSDIFHPDLETNK
ncbi:hypothetical protein P4E94_16275 [Pontiellaceae bacterium B12219]|nr:hypothetical protein [Pontiellaceae bacterium B12219]